MSPFSAVALGLLAPFGFGLLHGGICRLPVARGIPPQKLAAWACALGAALESSVWLRGLGWSAQAFLFTSVISGSTAHVYFHFFNMSETARRIRWLVARSQGKAPATEEGTVEKTARRLERLISLGEIEQRGHRFFSRRGPLTRVAKILVAYERILFHERFNPRRG